MVFEQSLIHFAYFSVKFILMRETNVRAACQEDIFIFSHVTTDLFRAALKELPF